VNITTTFSDIHAGEGWGRLELISHAALPYNPDEETQYLKDDTLYFRVSVDMHKVKQHQVI
jgi:hypothetical protein